MNPTPTISQPKKYKAKEVAKILDVSISTVYALQAAGLLVPIRTGLSKGYRWTDEIIEKFLEKRGLAPAKKVVTRPLTLKHLSM